MSPDPDQALVAAAGMRLRAAPDLVVRHSLRMAALADELARRDGLDVDRAGMFCACAFHDLGMGVAGAGPFPARSADLLGGFLAQHGVPAARSRPLVEAVRRHLEPPLPGSRRGPAPEIALLRRVAWLDVLGLGNAPDRRLRRELRVADLDPVVDVRLTTVIGTACARDMLAVLRSARGLPRGR
jgi:hypothetical protein